MAASSFINNRVYHSNIYVRVPLKLAQDCLETEPANATIGRGHQSLASYRSYLTQTDFLDLVQRGGWHFTAMYYLR